ncbi:MAG TPA: TadE/TadG family type IV pilus assembly protein [Mycobacterium sp.]|nr:TadE/TadG family type IV pilus assembly protein [Mycobacterium sp.]
MRMFRRLVRDDRGATVVEFAIVGPMFILLLLAIIEMGLMMLTQFVLDGATRTAARMIRTGQVQTSANPFTAFQTALCSQIASVLPNCSGVLIEVQAFPNGFANITFPKCTESANEPPVNGGTPCPFNTGNAGEVVGVRVSYARPYIVPWVGQCLTTGSCWLGVGTHYSTPAASYTTNLMSTVVFQNEPYQ